MLPSLSHGQLGPRIPHERALSREPLFYGRRWSSFHKRLDLCMASVAEVLTRWLDHAFMSVKMNTVSSVESGVDVIVFFKFPLLKSLTKHGAHQHSPQLSLSPEFAPSCQHTYILRNHPVSH